MDGNNGWDLKKELFHLGFDTTETPSWEELAPMPEMLHDPSVAKVDDFRFVVVGRDGRALVYDMRSNSWTRLPAHMHDTRSNVLPSPDTFRQSACSVTCVNETIYVVYKRSIRCLDMSALPLEWTGLEHLPIHDFPIHDFRAAITVSQCIYLFSRCRVYIFDTESGQITRGPSSMFFVSPSHFHVVKNGNRIYVVSHLVGSEYWDFLFLTVNEQSGRPIGEWNMLNAPPRKISWRNKSVMLVGVGDSLVIIDMFGGRVHVLDIQGLFWWSLTQTSIENYLFDSGAVALESSKIVVFGRMHNHDNKMVSLQVQLPPPASLFQQCELALASQLSMDNILDNLRWATKYGASNLIQSCVEFASENGVCLSQNRSRQESEKYQFRIQAAPASADLKPVSLNQVLDDQRAFAHKPSSHNVSQSTLLDDALLAFLKEHAVCIKGTPKDFCHWLLDIESIACLSDLAEAVADEDYLKDTLKAGSRNVGVKGFKLKAFRKAVVAASLPLSETTKTQNRPPPLRELMCPISHRLMTNDPVLASDGVTYERDAIVKYFQKEQRRIQMALADLADGKNVDFAQAIVDHGVVSPFTNEKFVYLDLVPNFDVLVMAHEKAAAISRLGCCPLSI